MPDELNKKLAEWAGFTLATTGKSMAKGLWYDYPLPSPNGDINGYLPNLTQSLDACFKWLVPKLQDMGISIDLIAFEHKGFRCICDDIVHNDFRLADVRNDNPALALCLAIEKLIDGGKDA